METSRMPSEVSLPGPVESMSLGLSRGEEHGVTKQTQMQSMQHTQGGQTHAPIGETGAEAGATRHPGGSEGTGGTGGTGAPVPTTEMTGTTTPAALESGPAKDVMLALSPSPSRNRLARSHFRSRSLAEVPRMPPMTRAYSSPGLDSRGRYIFGNGRGTSMSGTGGGGSSSSKENSMVNGLQASTTTKFGTGDLESKLAPLTISEPIAEHAEFDLESSTRAGASTFTQQQQHHTFPRMGGRRRPSSPLHVNLGNNTNYNSYNNNNNSNSSNVGIPIMGSPTLSSKFNEAFPAYSSSSASSIPSTPTSLRSRSPSISSLETIPDIPDAEAAASEDDQVAALKAAADREDEGGNRRRTHDVSGPIVRFGRAKRWSVCGAERRQDLDLETIWED